MRHAFSGMRRVGRTPTFVKFSPRCLSLTYDSTTIYRRTSRVGSYRVCSHAGVKYFKKAKQNYKSSRAPFSGC